MSAFPAAVDEAALHGPAGEFVLATEPHSEAHPMALLAQFLVAFGTACGRGGHYQVEADHHYPNQFCVLVGPSAKGRKGSSGATLAVCFKTPTQASSKGAWSAG